MEFWYLFKIDLQFCCNDQLFFIVIDHFMITLIKRMLVVVQRLTYLFNLFKLKNIIIYSNDNNFDIN